VLRPSCACERCAPLVHQGPRACAYGHCDATTAAGRGGRRGAAARAAHHGGARGGAKLDEEAASVLSIAGAEFSPRR
jgi:hypothetical protein